MLGRRVSSRAMKAYLDNMASTPLDPRVSDAMMPYLSGLPGNPHATAHPFGARQAKAVEEARGRVARALGVRTGQVVFTPSATAANNLAVLGVAMGRRRRGNHVLVSAIEHPSVLGPARHLGTSGFEVEEVRCDGAGVVDPDEVRQRLRPETILVSIMAVNNEVGTIQMVGDVARICHEASVLVHCDASQAPGKVDLSDFLGADFITLSSHKVYGPKGAAALVVRAPGGFRPRPILFGGGQEGGLWPGTLNTAAVVGFGLAIELAVSEREADCARVSAFRERLLLGIQEALPGSRANGARTVPHCLSITLNRVAGETALAMLSRAGVAASLGSACETAAATPSRVLVAMGLPPAECRRTLRFGLGRFTTGEDIDAALEVFTAMGRACQV